MKIHDFVKPSERLAHFKHLSKNSTKWCFTRFNRYENQNEKLSLQLIDRKKGIQLDPRDARNEVPMLIFPCWPEQSFWIGKETQIIVLEVANGSVRIGIAKPPEIIAPSNIHYRKRTL